jgi:hypothetical protein
MGRRPPWIWRYSMLVFHGDYSSRRTATNNLGFRGHVTSCPPPVRRPFARPNQSPGGVNCSIVLSRYLL